MKKYICLAIVLSLVVSVYACVSPTVTVIGNDGNNISNSLAGGENNDVANTLEQQRDNSNSGPKFNGGCVVNTNLISPSGTISSGAIECSNNGIPATPIPTGTPIPSPTPSATPSPSPSPTPSPTPTPSCLPTPSGLVAWWAGDGNTNDQLGVHNGTAQNGLSFTPGFVEQSFNFDGFDDHMTVPDNPSLQITGELTITGWIKIDDPNLNNFMRIISKKLNFGDLEGYEMEYNPQLDTLTLISSGNNLAQATGVALDTNWHHIAGTIDGANAKLYVDGVDVTTDDNIDTLLAGNTHLSIGQISSGGAYFDGMIDELQLYNRALSQSEVQDIFNIGADGVCK